MELEAPQICRCAELAIERIRTFVGNRLRQLRRHFRERGGSLRRDEESTSRGRSLHRSEWNEDVLALDRGDNQVHWHRPAANDVAGVAHFHDALRLQGPFSPARGRTAMRATATSAAQE